jgi:DNA (cytosine-5)-methyltransferase 1
LKAAVCFAIFILRAVLNLQQRSPRWAMAVPCRVASVLAINSYGCTWLLEAERMIGVDLFCGAGGMTLGAKLAGVDVVFAVEADEHAADTYALNHPEVNLFRKDIRKLKEIPLCAWGQQTILFGGPPCQGFSTSNQRTRNKQNRGNWMFREFVRLAKAWRPDWVVFENVKGIAETEGAVFLEMVKQNFSDLEYTLSDGVLDAADFGVPQRRERLFMIGSLHGIEIPMPAPTVTKPIPVKSALTDLPDLENGARADPLPYKSAARSKYVRQLRNGETMVTGNAVTRNAKFVTTRYKHVPQGGNWEDIPKRLMKNYRQDFECHTGIYHRLDPSKPSVVI